MKSPNEQETNVRSWVCRSAYALLILALAIGLSNGDISRTAFFILLLLLSAPGNTRLLRRLVYRSRTPDEIQIRFLLEFAFALALVALYAWSLGVPTDVTAQRLGVIFMLLGFNYRCWVTGIYRKAARLLQK